MIRLRKQNAGKRTLWCDAVREVIADALRNNPFLCAKDLRQLLKEKEVVSCKSDSTVRKWLHEMNFSRKRVSGKYVVRNQSVADKVTNFKGLLRTIPVSNTISIDETAVYFSENSKYGYTPRGVPLRHRAQPGRKSICRRMTLLMAVSADKVIHHKLFDGSCNSSLFSEFIRELPQSCPQHVLMDNVAFHKTIAVRTTLKECGLNEVFVPPYSPQFNPIEYIFGALKKSLRRYVDVYGCLDASLVAATITTAVTQTVLTNSFAHVWKLAA